MRTNPPLSRGDGASLEREETSKPVEHRPQPIPASVPEHPTPATDPAPVVLTNTPGGGSPDATAFPLSSAPSQQRESANNHTVLHQNEQPVQQRESTPRVSRELKRLADFNRAGTNEDHPRDLPQRTRRTPSRFTSAAYVNDASPHVDESILRPSHPTYRRFVDEDHLGYYELQASQLGYSSTEKAPKLCLMQVEDPESVDGYGDLPENFEFKSVRRATSDPDTLTWDQAMSESPENVKQWLKAADLEIKALEDKHTFDEVPISAATVKVIPGTWVFRRKRDPATGEITKWKARWVLRGDLQELDMDTHAPTVAWSSVRLFLAICLIQGWTMKALDFANAFCQSYLGPDTPVFAYLPRGYQCMMEAQPGQRTILRLRKSQYGLTIAPKLWYEHLRKALDDMGFKASSYDPCLLFQKGMILVTYVDDCGLGVDDPKKIDWFVSELRKRGFELEVEGDFTAFLGVAIDRTEDGRIHMHQTALIDKIIKTAEMQDCNPNYTPAATTALGSDENGEPWAQYPWKYSSIVGMMVYLSTNTRPDIAYAVSSVGRFNRCPKKSHASAVKTIIRYLKGTRDKGIYIEISNKLNLETYCDADFCGLFGSENARDRNSARSRGGYIISFGGVPLIWKSFLISRICLSTLESEYCTLSKTMVQVIALENLIREILDGLLLNQGATSTLSSCVFEDNNGALLLATKQRITSRTKYFLSSWHHFWSHVSTNGGEDGKTVIMKISTDKQRADYLSKGLSRELFENNRRLNQGW